MSPRLPEGILVGWYGDDFTGSAATMEVLAFAGVPSVLFQNIPTPEMLARFPNIRAVGIASTARSHGPEWMEEHLPPAFDFLRETGAPVVHYKVCSTLDSAPHVGSIGKAIDIGARVIGTDLVPFLVAAPVMRRYQVFGNLFAAAGDGVYRLDRHPVMGRHPVTPMGEADVGRHLSAQTDQRFGTITIEDLERDPATALTRERTAGAQVVTLDAMTQAHMRENGALIWNDGTGQTFVAGSQGVEYALVAHWRAAGLLQGEDQTAGAGPVDQIVAVSGSVSPTTAAQIDWAGENGFALFQLDPALAVDETRAPDLETFAREMLRAVEAGRDVLIYSARGPDDPSVARMRAAVERSGTKMEAANAQLGRLLGRLLKDCFEKFGIKRAVISGGDTSGHAARELGIYAFTALAPTIPGAALLTAYSDNPALNGLQIALKGGQMGSLDYFGWIKRGGGAA